MTPPLWQAEEILRCVRGQCLHEQTWNVRGLSIDSRTVKPGDLFIALQGPSFDGHAFVGNAIRAGASAALIHHATPFVPPEAPLIEVEDTLKALQALAREGRARNKGIQIAVTGSVGKTTCKDQIKLLLRDADSRAYGSEGGLNNHWGVPLSLARLPAQAPYGVFEMGMNHKGELADLSCLVSPDIALITGVETAHLASFDSLDAIADAKAEIFKGLKREGTAILNRDNEFFERLYRAAHHRGIKKILTFGRHPKSDARLLKWTPTPDGAFIEALVCDVPVSFRFGAPGAHLALSSVAALLAASCAGIDITQHAEALCMFHASEGRGAQRVIYLQDGGTLTLIDESYNANPASVRAAIAVLAKAPKGLGGKRIMVLGDMLELGAAAPLLHAGLAADLVAAGIDRVYCCGPLMAHLYDALPPALRGAYAADSQALAPLVAEGVEDGDVVSVKGSHNLEMVNVINKLASKMLSPEPEGAARASQAA